MVTRVDGEPESWDRLSILKMVGSHEVHSVSMDLVSGHRWTGLEKGEKVRGREICWTVIKEVVLGEDYGNR